MAVGKVCGVAINLGGGTPKPMEQQEFEIPDIPAVSAPTATEIALVAPSVLLDDGGSYTDESTDAGDADADDFPLIPNPATSGDGILFGHSAPFDFLRVQVSTAGNHTASPFVLAYWNGSSWATATTLVSTLDRWTTSGIKEVVLNKAAMSDWAATSLGGLNKYWLRYYQNDSSFSYTTYPLGQQAWIADWS